VPVDLFDIVARTSLGIVTTAAGADVAPIPADVRQGVTYTKDGASATGTLAVTPIISPKLKLESDLKLKLLRIE
jgi:hypothetical protein